jgi:hypothetical protein
MKGKHWGKLTAQPGTEYQQRSSGESHKSGTASKFVPGVDGKEYAQRSSGESHSGSPSGKFLGPTKGNKDFPPNHTSGVSQGQYKGS